MASQAQGQAPLQPAAPTTNALIPTPATPEPSTENIDPKNIQGDIIAGLPKNAEVFYFFQIKNANKFRAQLARLLPQIASADAVAQARDDIAQHKRWCNHGPLEINFTNIAFSQKGLTKLGIKGDIKDSGFTNGQLADAQALGDEGNTHDSVFEPDWKFPFKHDIDGVILVAGDSIRGVNRHLADALTILHGSVSEVYKTFGQVRPGKEKGHEHFGFEDGISQPAIDGLSVGNPGDDSVKPGVILLGRDGDSVADRPAWAKDGSFLAFRLLNQLVPEFNKFLIENAIKTPLDPSVKGSDLLGARLVGRWKSGAPITVSPLRDDPALAADASKRNDFDYDLHSQEKCPFAAHTRKTYPRNDIGEDASDPHRIIRRGIQFGPEVTASEEQHNRTEHERGLLFVSYQANLAQGFQFLQKAWANNVGFPPAEPQQPGFDAIIGQAVGGEHNDGARTLSGTDPTDPTKALSLGIQRWVVPKGGEYFFSPSISALKETFSAVSA